MSADAAGATKDRMRVRNVNPQTKTTTISTLMFVRFVKWQIDPPGMDRVCAPFVHESTCLKRRRCWKRSVKNHH